MFTAKAIRAKWEYTRIKDGLPPYGYTLCLEVGDWKNWWVYAGNITHHHVRTNR